MQHSKSTVQTKRHRAALGFCVLLLIMTCSTRGPAQTPAPEPKRVMILHSFGQDFRPWGEYARTIRAELARQSPWPLDIQNHSILIARRGDGDTEPMLPPGSRIEFRQPTAWETNRWQVMAVAVVVLLQAALISVLLHERRRRRFAEVEARRRMSELAHANRYSMAGELTASIAHELNQPLGSILVNAETAVLMLEKPLFDREVLKDIVSDIRRDDQRASEVIRRLRSLLKRAPFEAKEIDLRAVIGEALDLVSGLAHARGVTVESVLPPDPLLVQGDRIQLQQVLLNLIINAADAMEDIDKSRRRIVVRAGADRGSAEIEIVDNGHGIPDGKVSEVFEPFFTTKQNGMGMGLSIARTILEAHDGRISAENRAGRGVVFRIRMPLVR